MGDRFVVLGSNSFSGASLISWLLTKDCTAKVVGISRSDEPLDLFLPYKTVHNYKDRFFFYRIDINKDIDAVIDIIRSFQPNYIVNFVAQGMVAQSWNDPAQWVKTNVLSLASLLKGIYRFDFIECFLQASTPEVYGSNDNMKECQCFSPSTPYAASKASADLLLTAYNKTYKFPVRYTRAANIYGPSQNLYRIIPKIILTALKNGQLPLDGGGASIRSFIHVDDVSTATYLILKKGCDGDIYHLSGEQSVSIRELVVMVCFLMDVEFDDFVYDVAQRTGTDSKYSLNADKISLELGWKASVSLSDGLSETIRWVGNNYEFLKNMPTEYIHKN